MSRHAVSAVGLEGSEPVSLSFTNELEKGNAKIITPRSHSACLSFPIVSETYPVVFHAHYHHQPFSSPGFQSLDPGQAAYQTPGQKSQQEQQDPFCHFLHHTVLAETALRERCEREAVDTDIQLPSDASRISFKQEETAGS